MNATILKLIEECGFMRTHVGKDKTAVNYVASEEELSRFADALLEMAARECEKSAQLKTMMKSPSAAKVAGEFCSEAIRALKSGGGESQT